MDTRLDVKSFCLFSSTQHSGNIPHDMQDRMVHTAEDWGCQCACNQQQLHACIPLAYSCWGQLGCCMCHVKVPAQCSLDEKTFYTLGFSSHTNSSLVIAMKNEMY